MSIENCHSSNTFPPPPSPTHNKYHLPFHLGKYSTIYLSIHASNNFKPQRSLKGKLWKVQKWNKILLKRMCELTCSHYFHMYSKAGLHDNSVIYCSLVLDITACRQQQSKQSRKSKEKGTRANPWTQKVKLLTAVFPRISASFPASKAVVFPSVGSRTRPPFFEGFLLSSSRRVRKKPKKHTRQLVQWGLSLINAQRLNMNQIETSNCLGLDCWLNSAPFTGRTRTSHMLLISFLKMPPIYFTVLTNHKTSSRIANN